VFYIFLLTVIGCEIRGGLTGVHLTQSREGRPSGEAFVEFECEEDLQAALKKNKEHLGSRYIEGV
jgi:heterogeneous nuclear ribonucleoprotein F/H